MRTSQAAESLGLTAAQLMHLRKYYAIDVRKDGDRYVWTEAHLEEIRAALRQKEQELQTVRQGLTAREAAGQLGIGYEELLRLIHEARIPVPRLGPKQYYAFDEASLEIARQALDNKPAPPPRPRGLTTKEVATALGVSYETVLTIMKPLREELSLQKDGFSLVWSPDAVALLRAALDRRHAQRSIAEAESYGEALQSLEVLAGTLQKLSAGVQKVHGLLSRKPAETAYLNTLPTQTHRLAAPVCVLLSADAKKGFQANLPELSLVTEGKTRAEVLRRMQRRLWNLYQEVRAAPQQAAAEWTMLQQLIVRQP